MMGAAAIGVSITVIIIMIHQHRHHRHDHDNHPHDNDYHQVGILLGLLVSCLMPLIISAPALDWELPGFWPQFHPD